MTFLNPLYLIGLAAAAIPIILHLLNLRKARRIDFSTLSFLKELQRSRIRKLKIKQWILLALRTLIIIFVVLAFTRPATRSSFGFLPGTRAKSSVVIILDDSFSMFASDNGGQLIKQARDKANAIIDMLRPGDEVALVRMSEAGKEGLQFTAAFGSVRTEVAAIQPTYVHIQLRDALSAASALLAKSVNFNKEIYVISDEQRSHYQLKDPHGGMAPLFDPSVRVFTVGLGEGRSDNTAVVDVKIENALFEKNRSVDLAATVLNDEARPLNGAVMSVFLNGERVAQKSVDIAAGVRATFGFTVTPKASGFVTGMVELEDDAIPEDNRRYFAFYVPDNLHILLGPTGGQDESLVALALKPTENDSASAFTIDAADRNAMLSTNFSKYDVVVLFGVQQESAVQLKQIAEFVSSGGGILVFPDAGGDADALSRVFLPSLGIPAPQGMAGKPGQTTTTMSFGRVDYDHPLFHGVFVEQNGKKPVVESPRISAALRLRADEGSQAVITLANGDAFLLDRRFGKGRALIFAVSPSLQWSDFPFKGIFVPLLNRAMFYLASREDNVIATDIDRPFDVLLPPGSASSKGLDLSGPSGSTLRLVPRSMPSGLAATISDLEQPGIYVLSSGGTPLRAIAANLDPSESQMERIPTAQRKAFFNALGIGHFVALERSVNVQQAVTEARFGVELWKYMLLLAILCAVIEMVLSQDLKKLRSQDS